MGIKPNAMKCFLCDEKKTIKFLSLGKQPLANKYPASSADFKTEDFFPLAVFFCPACKNVQLGIVVSRARMFEDYYYLSSVNPGLVRHFNKLAKNLAKAKAKFVVDVGSNDGILLKPLKELGVKAVGIDPSINVSKIANDTGLPTIVSFFNSNAVKKVKVTYGVPDVIVASSIFTHVEDPHFFIEDAKKLMSRDGKLIIEVEYIGNILANVSFERFYLDRVFYYSLTSLKNLFEAHDMHITDAEKIEPHGGSIKVTVQKNDCGLSVPSKRARFILEEEKKNLTPKKFASFSRKVRGQISAFRSKLTQYKKMRLKVAGYGAPARVATICNFGKITPSLIEFIVDDSPLKQNRFSPGTHIPIVPAAHLKASKPDVLVVFAHEYFNDIRKKTRGKYRYLLPMPPREAR